MNQTNYVDGLEIDQAINLGRMKQYQAELALNAAEAAKEPAKLITIAPRYNSAIVRDLNRHLKL